MARDPDESFREADIFLRGALELEGEIARASAAIRERSKIAYGHALLDARLALMAIINELVGMRAGEPGNTSAALSERLALTVAGIQGAGTTETLVSEGQYVKAASALRQDLEIVARLREIDEGLAKEGKVANVKFGTAGSGPVYGYLSGVTHVAKPEVINGLLARAPVGDVGMGVGIVPAFNEDAAVGFYELHVWLLMVLVREMIRVHLDLYGEDDATNELAHAMQVWIGVRKQLLDAGHLCEME